PVKEPGRLVQITRLANAGKPGVVSYPIFEYFRDNIKSISGAFAVLQSRPAIQINDTEELVNAEQVSGAYFSVLALEPAAGRLLEPADQELSSTPAAVISYPYWQRRFSGSAEAIGRKFVLRDRIFTIVGVLPPEFEGIYRGRVIDMAVPLGLMIREEQK